MDTSESSESTSGPRSKVSRLINRYELEGLGAELERRWTADDPEDRESLRDLADHVNQQLLGKAITEADMQRLDRELGTIYRLLTGDDASSADQTRVRRRLEREGIDIDSLSDDFVTYQAVRTYLTQYRDAEYVSDSDPLQEAEQTVQRLRTRVDTVIDDRITRLSTNGELSLGDFRIIVDTQVFCRDCERQFGVTELISKGGCNCQN